MKLLFFLLENYIYFFVFFLWLWIMVWIIDFWTNRLLGRCNGIESWFRWKRIEIYIYINNNNWYNNNNNNYINNNNNKLINLLEGKLLEFLEEILFWNFYFGNCLTKASWKKNLFEIYIFENGTMNWSYDLGREQLLRNQFPEYGFVEMQAKQRATNGK